MKNPSILWFRLDLRLRDNPAMDASVAQGAPVVPVFIWAPEEDGAWPPGGASRWWLHQSLVSLDASLLKLGSKLIVRRGPTLQSLRALVNETGASSVFWNRRYEPGFIFRDKTIQEALNEDGVLVKTFNSALLHEPETIQNQSGKPFQVFTPFWKRCLALTELSDPRGAPRNIPRPTRWPKSLVINELELEPRINWAGGLRVTWQPGEAGAIVRLKVFLAKAFDGYFEQRNDPGIPGTSRLSPHLHFGEISPRQVWHQLRQMAAKRSMPSESWRSSQFLAEVGWREFAHHLLFHFPQTPTEPLRSEFKKFPWRENKTLLKAWQKGCTGYPIVDAGMRELWTTGWMHNRVRMIAASFLVKDLLVDWQEGARWFWDTLVDADLAQNTLGWQWTAGCGADAAPFFRVFNPIGQGEKYDPFGHYVRKWVPELAKLPTEWLHKPWQAPPEILGRAGVQIGLNYPKPIVNHAIAREIALEAFATIRTNASSRA